MKSLIIFALIVISYIVIIDGELSLASENRAESLPLLSIWSSALSTAFFISIVPYLILFFIPLENTPKYEPFLKICLSLASGGLLGDAFLHLIPEALMSKSNDSNHSFNVGLWILSGFIGFFLVEKMVRIAKSETIKRKSSFDSEKVNKSQVNCIESVSNNNKYDNYKQQNVDNDIVRSVSFKDIEIAGYLNLAADLAHNFTDGLAIGSSFIAGQNVGLVTGIAIMFHEIPHEIGDYAVLIKSGCSRKKAMQLQLLTAIGAITGTIVSLFIGGFGDDGSSWVLPFTGGGFIYISTVTILPELIKESDFKQSIKELSALIFGIFIMTLVI